MENKLALLSSIPQNHIPSVSKKQHSTNVASHYNKRLNTTIQQRLSSPTYYLRNLHNWIKSVLIAEFCPEKANVLDICGGKGGDLRKYQNKGINHLILVDIAKTSVEQAFQRYNERLNDRRTKYFFTAKFIHANCGKHNFWKSINPLQRVDFVSCQFSMHYLFETESYLNNFLYLVSSRLATGGHFVATIPNSSRLIHRLKMAVHSNNSTKFGNKVYSITFDVDPLSDEIKLKRFGCSYSMWLDDCIDHLREYLVHIPTLESLALKYNLKLLHNFEFPEIVHKYQQHPNYAPLLKKIKVLNPEGSFSELEWEASSIYSALVFQKTGPSCGVTHLEKSQRHLPTQRKTMKSNRWSKPPLLDKRTILSCSSFQEFPLTPIDKSNGY